MLVSASQIETLTGRLSQIETEHAGMLLAGVDGVDYLDNGSSGRFV